MPGVLRRHGGERLRWLARHRQSASRGSSQCQKPVFGGQPSLSDNQGVRLSLKTINDELERLRSGAVLTKADGYFYFQGGDATDWLDRAVSVPTLRSLTLEQWIGRYRELKAKNKALLKGKISSKDFGTRRAQPAARNS